MRDEFKLAGAEQHWIDHHLRCTQSKVGHAKGQLD